MAAPETFTSPLDRALPVPTVEKLAWPRDAVVSRVAI